MDEDQKSCDVEAASTHTFQAASEIPTSENPAKVVNKAVPVEVSTVIAARYVTRRRLGKGGFGVVYLAQDTQLDRLVAVKLPFLGAGDSHDRLASLQAEARSAARFEHPNVVRVYDTGIHETLPYVVYEYVEGSSLQELLNDGSLARERQLGLLAQVARAVALAHRQGVVHRDLKPANILVDSSGTARITDFGLALNELTQHRHRGEVAGTVAYMSPEQLDGKSHQLDGRTDIWALGVILYRMLTDRLPFSGSSQVVREEIRERSPKPPRQIDPSVSKSLEKICLQCLAKSPDDRPSTAQDLADALERHLHPGRFNFLRKLVAATTALLLTAVFAFSIAAPANDFFSRIEEPVANEWHDVLKRPPTLLFHRGAPPEFNVVNGRLRVFSEDVVLLRLGNTTKARYSMRTDISQIGWLGYAGVFFGLQQPDGPDGPLNFETIEIARTPNGSYQLERSSCTVTEKGELHRITTAAADIDRLPDRVLQNLRIEVSQGVANPVRVFWNNQPLAELSNPLLPTAFSSNGAFGVLSRSGATVFSDFGYRFGVLD